MWYDMGILVEKQRCPYLFIRRNAYVANESRGFLAIKKKTTIQ